MLNHNSPNLLTELGHIHHEQIEWGWLREIITQFCYFDKTKHSLFKLFNFDVKALESEFSKIFSFENFFDYDRKEVLLSSFQIIPSENNLDKLIFSISKGSILTISELNLLFKLLESGLKIAHSFSTDTISEIALIREHSSNQKMRSLIKEFRFLIDSDGSINFERHPELKAYQKKLRDIEERIRKTIQDIIHNPNFSKSLQFSSYDIIYDRYVIPVRSDSYRSDLGIIISRSETGQTLFVEPFELRDLSNKRLETIAKIDEILNKISENFSRALFDYSINLFGIFDNLHGLDLYLTKINFHSSYSLNRPNIKSNPGFSFNNLFHPLIKGCVKNDVTLNSLNKGIIISGPNTGGKTVFLKSVTLSYLLFNHGFFVPADNAEMYPYKGLFYFGNDLQNLSSGLSSFSGEVKNYLNLFGFLEDTNLILIDEIFNSTSSDEASALSLAYFKKLHDISFCQIIVSTHHQMFKTLVHQDDTYLSCHVGFDTKELKPTYKIIWGTPGSSMAIEIFKILSNQISISKDIATNASFLLDNKNISYETLLQKVTEKQIELDKIITSTKKIEVDLRNQKGAMEGVLQLKLNEEISKAKKELEKIFDQAKDVLTQVKKNEIQKLRKIDEKEFTLSKQISNLFPKEITPPSPSPQVGNLKLNEIKAGDEVFSQDFKKTFRVISIDTKKNEILIAKGNFKISVSLNTLTKPTHKENKNFVKVSFTRPENSRVEIDARGMRLSEFQSIVDNSLGSLLSGDIPYLNVVHGHGDGILKSWLRDYLKKSRDFKGEIPENGNDGETKITLK